MKRLVPFGRYGLPRWRRFALLAGTGLSLLAPGCAQQQLTVAESPSALVARAAAPEPAAAEQPPAADRALPIGIDTVLRLAGEQNGQIAVARERVREAYAEQNLAQTAWLPAVNVGTAYYRHEGGIQLQEGPLIRSSTGALLGGVEIAGRIDPREAAFQKINAERKVWQQKGDLSRISSEVLLEAATTYIDLLTARTAEAAARQLLADEEEVLAQARELAKPGREPGTQFQVEAIEAEVYGLRALLPKLRQQGDAASKKLAYLLGLGSDVQLMPVDERLVALDLIDPSVPAEELTARALSAGPGVRELERLLGVIQAGREKAKGPGRLLPIVEFRMLEGGFGAGPGSRLDWANRWDLGVQARWNLTDLLRAPKLEAVADAQIQQAHLTYHDVRAKLTLGVQEARDASLAGKEEVRLASEAVKHARQGYDLSRRRLKDNVAGSTTTEVIQYIRGLQTAYLAYLATVAAYDKAQVRLLVLTGAAAAPAEGPGCAP